MPDPETPSPTLPSPTAEPAREAAPLPSPPPAEVKVVAPPAEPKPVEAPAAPQADAPGDAPREAPAEEASAEAAGEPLAEGSAPAAGGSEAPHAKRKRRRRRRKKGGSVAPGAAGIAGSDGAAAEGEVGPEPASGEQAADGAAKDTPDAKPDGGKAGHDKAGHKKKRHKKRDHTHPPRERVAFTVGDVIFGKIIEITDEAIFVDLAGKGKAIFDRRELDLPDDPPEGEARESDKPEKPSEAELADADTADVDAMPSSTAAVQPLPVPTPSAPNVTEAASRESAPADRTPSEKAIELAAAVPEGFTEAPTDPGLTPFPAAAVEQHQHQQHRRIVKAKALLEAEAKEREEAEAKALVIATDGVPDADVHSTTPPTDTAATEPPPPPAPHPPMYAPPVVLELGAHFVALVHNDGARGGLVVLTRHPRRIPKTKLAVVKAFKDKTKVEGLVTGVVKGGLEVDVEGLRGFAPGSHMDMRLGADLHPFIGRRLDFFVTQYGKRGRDLVLSRKAMIEEEAKAARVEALAKLAVGSVVEGTVRSVVTFGAFIDIGGVEGLVSLPEMSHNRAETPSDVFKAGETVQVRILKIDDRGKVWLSRKQAVPDPWFELAKKYAVGTRHTGKVARLQPFGAFIELEHVVDGLIHSADLSLKRFEHPEEIVKIGDSIEVVVASVDPGAHKIGLHPAPMGAAAEEARQKVVLHKPVKCAVVAIEPGGLLVRILGATGRHARGFITAAATGTPRGTELRRPFPPGTQLEAKVMELDPKRGEVKLSIKALREETERTAYQQYRAQVKAEAKFGTFADLLAKKNQTQK
jgi:ribosomal protein S1